MNAFPNTTSKKREGEEEGEEEREDNEGGRERERERGEKESVCLRFLVVQNFGKNTKIETNNDTHKAMSSK